MNIINSVSEALHLSEQQVLHYITQAPHRYKVYEIPKRSGAGSRVIAQPSKELKFIQRLVADKFLSDFPVHTAAQAYRKGVGIRSNAEQHKENAFLLKMDFKDFFPSIKPDALLQFLKAQGADLSELDEYCLSKLFFWQPRRDQGLQLSIGAPSSPLISNMILWPFDKLISKYSKENGVTYTRYADDLTFTTNEERILFNFPEVVKDICNQVPYPSLEINVQKTIFSSKRHNRHVTGLVLTNEGEISIGRKKKRVIKSKVHRFIEKSLSIEEINQLKGHLAYIQDVEPNFLAALEKKYTKQVINSIKSFEV